MSFHNFEISFITFDNLEEFEEYIKDSNLEMFKRNFCHSSYKYIGIFVNDLFAGAAAIQIIKDKKIIKIFQIDDRFQRKGLGRKLSDYIEQKYPTKYSLLEPLDDEAESFWIKLGYKLFTDPENEDLTLIKINN